MSSTKSYIPPVRTGHLIEVNLTTGKTLSIDPGEIASLTPHRSEAETTVCRLRGEEYLHFIDAPYPVVAQWIRECSPHLLELSLTNEAGLVSLDPGELRKLSPHRQEEGTTAWEQLDDAYTYFIDMPYEELAELVRKSDT